MGLNFLSRNEIGTCGLAIIETTDDRSHCAVPFSDQLRGGGALL